MNTVSLAFICPLIHPLLLFIQLASITDLPLICSLPAPILISGPCSYFISELESSSNDPDCLALFLPKAAEVNRETQGSVTRHPSDPWRPLSWFLTPESCFPQSFSVGTTLAPIFPAHASEPLLSLLRAPPPGTSWSICHSPFRSMQSLLRQRAVKTYTKNQIDSQP